MKTTAKIDHWDLWNNGAGYRLIGRVSNHERQDEFNINADTQITSQLLSIDFANKRAETLNTIYELGENDGN